MNEQEIRQWYDIFKNNEEIVEVRIFDGKKPYSGYFTDIETLLAAIRPFAHNAIYVTFNRVKDACYDRTQKDKIVYNPKSQTSDKDILSREWIMIDFDPIRPTDCNATEEEKAETRKVVNNVYAYLRDLGFNPPVVIDSANGYHLFYKVRLGNDKDYDELVRDFLKVLSMMFSNEHVDIDKSVFNASRITKLVGTSSAKGSHTNNRPQRESRFIRIPDDIRYTEKIYIQKVVNEIPKQEVASRHNNYSTERFDIEAFFEKYNIEISNKVVTNDYTKYVLSECVFDSNHKAPDAAIFVMNNGAIGYKCFHASCQSYTFKDFRLHFDPTAYDKKEYNIYQQKQRFRNFNASEMFVKQEETLENGKKWLSMTDIEYVDMSLLPTIPIGYDEFDKKITGLMLGDVSILSGTSGCGKTSWLDCIILNVIQKGFKVGVWSGELQDFRFQSWLNQIAAGRSYVKKKDGYENLYYTPRNIADKINHWLDGKLFIYNNNYGNKWNQLFEDIKDLVERENPHLIIADNLMSLSIDSYEGDKYSQQTKFINDVKEFAKKKNIHIILVAHPRKDMQLLRKESISGTADITNLADNVFIIHRVGNDFTKRAGEFLGVEMVNTFANFSTVVEICKNRSHGVVDTLVGMYYEKESRRLKNTLDEHIVYGWQEVVEEQTIECVNDIPINENYDVFSHYGEDIPF